MSISDKLTKPQLVELATDLKSQVDSLSSAPLTASTLEKRKLDLIEKIADVDVKMHTLDQEHALKLAELKADYELKKQSFSGDIVGEHTALKKEVEDMEKFLSSSLAIAEIQHGEKLEAMNKEVEEASKLNEERLQSEKDVLEKFKDDKKAQIASLTIKHNREIEEKEYAHEQALIKKDKDYADEVAEELAMVLVFDNELEELRKSAKTDEEETKKAVDEAYAKATNIAKSTAEKTLTKTENEAALKINTLETKVEAQDDRIKDLIERNNALQAQVDNASSQLVEALKAAKADVKVSQESKK
jgi:hypothetical protein